MNDFKCVTDTGWAANIGNLTALWQRFGATSTVLQGGAVLNRSIAWPNRVWFQPDSQPARLQPWQHAVDSAPLDSTFVVWDTEHASAQPWLASLDTLGLAPTSELSAMTVPANSIDTRARTTLEIETIIDSSGAQRWSALCSRCFGYSINDRVITAVASRPDVCLMSGIWHGKAVATALLYRTGQVTGVHQVGVDPEYRGRGIARAMMLRALCMANRSWSPSLFVLQASAQGRGLYQQLGFRHQFQLGLFKRSEQ